jgi:hypothetical protein
VPLFSVENCFLPLESHQAQRIFSTSPKTMSRNFYILAATLFFFALLSASMSLLPSSFQPGLPANVSLANGIALSALGRPRRRAHRRPQPSL